VTSLKQVRPFEPAEQTRRIDAMNRPLHALASLVVVVSALCFAAPVATSAEPDIGAINRELSVLIEAVRGASDSSEQERAARNLPTLVDQRGASAIDAKTLEDLASLLEVPNNAARRWVVVTLALFDSRAGFTAPRLIALHQEAYCGQFHGGPDAEFVQALQFAMRSIGLPPPPPVVCQLKFQDQDS
jgi:hypothetical protein